MKKKIFKYTLKTKEKQIINLPEGAEILTIQSRFNEPQLWALVNPDETNHKEICVEIFGTGHEICYDIGVNRRYLATFQVDDGNYVFHVFEMISYN